MKKILTGVILIAITAAFSSLKTDLPKSGWKKVEKEWNKLWSDRVIKKEEIRIATTVNEELKIKDLTYSLYKLHSEDKLVAYMMISKAFGRYDFFDYMVIYNPDFTIKSTKVLIYREDWGGEITSTRWLKQFIGMSSKDQIKMDYDIQGISGATISCRSTVLGVKQLTTVISELYERGLLE